MRWLYMYYVYIVFNVVQKCEKVCDSTQKPKNNYNDLHVVLVETVILCVSGNYIVFYIIFDHRIFIIFIPIF